MALYDKKNVDNLIESNRLKPEARTGLVYDSPDGPKEVVIAGQSGGANQKKQKRHNAGWWPEEKKIEVATLYAALGNYTKVAALAKVPKTTCERWGQEDWFLQTLQKVRREEGWLTDKKFSSIVDKALDKLQERIEEGDYVYDIKRGCAVPMPVSARDLAIVTGTIFDKRQLLRGEATKITQAVNSEEHLKQLANKFEEYVRTKEKEINAIQVESTTEVDVQSETGISEAVAIGDPQSKVITEESK